MSLVNFTGLCAFLQVLFTGHLHLLFRQYYLNLANPMEPVSLQLALPKISNLPTLTIPIEYFY